MFRFTFLLLTIIFAQSQSQERNCPESGFPEECTCYDETIDFRFHCKTGLAPENPWNVSRTFEKVVQAFNNPEIIMDEITVAGDYTLIPTVLPAASITQIHTRTLELYHQDGFSTFDLTGSTPSKHLTFFVYVNCVQLCPPNIFEFIKGMKNVKNIIFSIVNQTIVPSGAFASNPKLLLFDAYSCNIEKIEDNAFQGLPNIEIINLDLNSLQEKNIGVNAFADLPSFTYITMQHNPGVGHLAEDKFKHFLDRNGTLRVGQKNPWPFPADPNNRLHCDMRADWICKEAFFYSARIEGFQCREDEYEDVFDYCNQKFGTNVHSSLRNNKTKWEIYEQLRETKLNTVGRKA